MNTANYYYINTIYNKIIQVLCVCVICIISFPAFSQDNSDIQIANEYFLKGDKEKALTMYETLAKRAENIPQIHDNYLSLMLDMGKFRDAESYVERLVKKHDDRLNYKLDLGFVYLRSGEEQKADRYFKSVIKNVSADIYRIRSVSDYLVAHNLAEYASLALLEARNSLHNNSLFTLELANLYRLQGKRDEMVDEYLNYVTQTPANIGYVKNLLQILLSKPEELESLEKLLYDRVQQNPQSEVFSDLLIWVNLQQKNFYGAFIQSRAYDKRFKKETPKTLEIAQIALNNNDFDNADKSFSYVMKEYANTENYLPARLGQIKAREAKVKRKYPVNRDSIRYLLTEYESFISKYPENPNAHEAQLNEASLFAYYLDEKDSAIAKLNKLIQNQRASLYLKSKAKLELGDIYLLKEEPWESTLLYSQVERMQKDAPIGYEAKLRNAKLSYFKGEFALAQEHLDILKQATTREIANDAMDLSMRINENLGFDSIGFALRQYAKIELLLQQNKTVEAMKLLKRYTGADKVWVSDAETTLLELTGSEPRKGDSVQIDNPITRSSAMLDDFYWLEANLEMKQGHFDQSIAILQKIIDQFAEDILSDDALFLQADIYQNQLKNKDKAMEIYHDFLTKFPGSVYVAEARKRYRLLRGDFKPES
ncbi:MAG TPA: tetratricopeptide repeat protein [Cyclobacteriaceae bacterium]|nr:tetratricopeptide repeat protein [Cyclobacteriaceae bacterium]